MLLKASGLFSLSQRHTHTRVSLKVYACEIEDFFPGEAGGATCPKFNLVGPEEIDNLQLARMISSNLGKELNYTMVDFHSSRPGHDLRLESGSWPNLMLKLQVCHLW